MNSFEERKKEFFKKIKNKPEVLNNLIKSNMKTEKGRKNLEIILTPKNEKELSIAELTFEITNDLLELINNITFDEVKTIPLNENDGLNLLIDIVNAMKNDKKSIDLNEKTSQYFAKVLYGLTVGLMGEIEESITYIADKTGFDLNDELETAQFNIYLSQAKNYSDSLNMFNNDIKEITDINLEEARELVEEFHKLCIEGKKDFENESVSEKIARELTKTLYKTFKDIEL